MNAPGNDLTTGHSGAAVRALHWQLKRLGGVISAVEDAAEEFGEATRHAVMAFQKSNELEPSGVVDPDTAAKIAAAVAADVYAVDGKVASLDRAGIGGLSVEIVDKGVPADVPVAQATTDERGRWSATFDAQALQSRQKQHPDLQARISAGTTFLAASSVRWNASHHETLDVLLPAGMRALPSEHETLSAALAVHYSGSLTELKEGDGRADITYLANKSGWDARAVAMAALAEQLAHPQAAAPAASAPAIAPAFYYALLRAGAPADPQGLYQVDAQTVDRVWSNAIDAGIIPAQLAGQRAAALETYRTLSAAHALDARALTGASTLREMLTVSLGADEQKHREFADLYARNGADLPKFWDSVTQAFGPDTVDRLQLDGRLARMTLNNAALVGRVHEAQAHAPLASPLDLAQRGYYRAAAWTPLLDATVPQQIPGANAAERSANYAELLAAQVRVSYPTAVVGDMVKTGALPLAAAASGVQNSVASFLSEHQAAFHIGLKPVEQFIVQNGLAGTVAPAVTSEVMRIQRVYQITPDDTSMTALLQKGLDSAHAIVRYAPEDFIRVHGKDVGGADRAKLIYDKAYQVHNNVLNVAIGYVTSQRLPALGSGPDSMVIVPGPSQQRADPSVVANPTLEKLFGSLDFCACEECRSILGPAAYLVDLLHFIDLPADAIVHGQNPQSVLLSRRPDIQHLPLTCENTTTPVPYIDLVNEILEYFVVNGLKIAGYGGHDTGAGATPAELLASPQFVLDAAYATLANASFPAPLPFHRELEALRRYYAKFGVPLDAAMETLRTGDAVERANAASYGWRDILLERLGISRKEYAVLTGHAQTLQTLFGFAPGAADADVLATLSGVKAFSRRAGITFDDVAAMLRTRFVNPNSVLIPKLEALGVPFSTLAALKNGALSDADFTKLLPPDLDPAAYGGNVANWVKDDANYARITGLITIVNPKDPSNLCAFDALEFRYAKPDAPNALHPIDYHRMVRFTRLWKKLGWSISNTDKAITALYPDPSPASDGTLAGDLLSLEAGFAILLPRLGIVHRVAEQLNVQLDQDLAALLACWSPIDVHGTDSLYRAMFLSPALLAHDPAFADRGGTFLSDATKKLLPSADTLRAAFNVTAAEFDAIVAALKFDATTGLTLQNVSAVYRWAWLARRLRMSVREFLALTGFTGLDPFAPPDPPNPDAIAFVTLVNALSDAAVAPAQALYLLWNRDLNGKAVPPDALITGFARTLRADFAGIESDFALVDDPGGDIARARMALVYGGDATDYFFGLLNGTQTTSTAYSNAVPALDPAIVAAGQGRIVYDDLAKTLAYAGVMSDARRTALRSVPGVTAAFQNAVDALHTASQAAAAPFFARYPELSPLETAYEASTEPPQAKRAALLAHMLPELKLLRKQQQAFAATSAATNTAPAYAPAILADAGTLHAANDATKPALDDLIALETTGLLAQFFFHDTAGGVPDATADAPLLDYAAPAHPLPPNPTAGHAISGVWSGYVEAPQSGSFGLEIDADAGATVTVAIAGNAVALTPPAPGGTVWRNAGAITLTAGTLYPVRITAEKITAMMRVQWSAKGRGSEVVPARYLYSTPRVDALRATLIRFLKATSLGTALHLTANELAHAAADPDALIAGFGWLNALAVTGEPSTADAKRLGEVLVALLDLARLKAALSPGDERLLAVLRNPATTLPDQSSLLLAVTGWDASSRDALLARFGAVIGDLAHVRTFRRLYDALAAVSAFGVAPAVITAATTNDPDPATVLALQSALRARYAQSDWLAVLKPINDTLRELQRDALVAYILQQFGQDPATAIDTPDKLYEFFLVDTQMAACMETSRIRLALSTVQLFIERALMNLEPEVSPTSIKANQWEWMKRYRVWQANREVFLWPENWAEPELRDDQSVFFKQTLSALLQHDITEDSAAAALLDYLAKLADVARLEPCGIYYEEDPTGTAGDVAHVVARSSGAHRKYYYRRLADAAWTPWEDIKLEIEGDPVIPVVWNSRLLLFWLRILKRTPVNADQMQAGTSAPGSIAGLSLDKIKGDAKVTAAGSTQMTVEAVLCYSEYYNGKWQTTRTSDVDRPALVTIGTFDRSLFHLGSFVDGDHLWITIDGANSFMLYNTHSAPVRGDDAPDPAFDSYFFSQTRAINDSGDHVLRIWYDKAAFALLGWGMLGGGYLMRSVLTSTIQWEAIPPRHSLTKPWDAPFFFKDDRYVFYVTTAEETVLIGGSTGYGILLSIPTVSARIPPLVNRAVEEFTPIRDPIGPVSAFTNVAVIDPSPVERFISSSSTIRTAIASSAPLNYGGAQIGLTGGIAGRSATPITPVT